jgi:hypothetical protein
MDLTQEQSDNGGEFDAGIDWDENGDLLDNHSGDEYSPNFSPGPPSPLYHDSHDSSDSERSSVDGGPLDWSDVSSEASDAWRKEEVGAYVDYEPGNFDASADGGFESFQDFGNDRAVESALTDVQIQQG